MGVNWSFKDGVVFGMTIMLVLVMVLFVSLDITDKDWEVKNRGKIMVNINSNYISSATVEQIGRFCTFVEDKNSTYYVKWIADTDRCFDFFMHGRIRKFYYSIINGTKHGRIEYENLFDEKLEG